MDKQKDNSTFREKAALRRKILHECADPVVMETHGGAGKIYLSVYQRVRQGIVIEKNPRKVDILAQQRPAWSVYEADSERAIRDGAGAHLCVNFLDCDPYGDPWPVLSAWFASHRPRAPRLWIVVNDGLPQKLKANGAWVMEHMQPAVQRFGNTIYHQYLTVARWKLEQEAAPAGYAVRRFEGYFCGHSKQMAHYAACLEQGELPGGN